MNVRTQIRRAFPYLVIAVAGFAVAYVLVFVFILPAKIIPGDRAPYVRDTAEILEQTDAGSIQPAPNSIGNSIGMVPNAAPLAPIPVDVPNLVGMQLPDARGVLNSLLLNTVVRYDTSSIDAPNTILHQSPQIGAKVSQHGTILVTVSRLPTAEDTMPVRHDSLLSPIQPADTDAADADAADTDTTAP